MELTEEFFKTSMKRVTNLLGKFTTNKYLSLTMKGIAKKLLISIAFVLIIVLNANSQIYSDLHSKGCSFDSIVSITDDYYKDRFKGKHSGYKQYERWKYWAERSLNANREIRDFNYVQNEIVTFKANQRAENRTNRSAMTNTWEYLGPDSITSSISGHLGRITSISVNHNDPNHIVVGSDGGGVWHTYDKGQTWIPLMNDLPLVSTQVVEIHPDSSNVYYAGIQVAGLFKTTNSGVTWTNINISAIPVGTPKRILIDSINSAIIIAAENKIWRSEDHASTWTQVYNHTIGGASLLDLEFHPTNHNIIYASGKDDLVKSIDNGTTFSALSGPWGNGIKHLATTNDAPNSIYVLEATDGGNISSFKAIHLSTDQGNTWTTLYTGPLNLLGSQAARFIDMVVSPTNNSEIHVGGLDTYKSDNLGVSWTQTTDWIISDSLPFIHADVEIMIYQNGVIYYGTDGGLFISEDGGNSFIDLSKNLGVTQQYKIASSSQSKDLITFGSQDNGTSVLLGSEWFNFSGGDGMSTFFAHADTNKIYSSIQRGTKLYKTDDGGITLTELNKVNSYDQSGYFVIPFLNDPLIDSTLYACYSQVYRSDDDGHSWLQLGVLPSGSTDIRQACISPSDNQTIVVSDNNHIYRTVNGGKNWHNINPTFAPTYFTNSIDIHPDDPNRILIASSGSTYKIIESFDGGISWTDLTLNLPDLSVYDAIYEKGSPNGIYIAAQPYVYYKTDNLSTWSIYGNGLVSARVTNLAIDHNTLYASTYGRGSWKVDVENEIFCAIDSIIDQGIVSCNNGTNTYSRKLKVYYEAPAKLGPIDINGQTFPLAYQPETVILQNLPLDGQSVNLSVSFTEYPTCNITLNNYFINPSSCPCVIQYCNVVINSCNDKSTDDPLDDSYDFTLEPQGIELNGTYSIVGDITVNSLAYGSPQTLNNGGNGFLIADGSKNITIVDDVDTSCTFNVSITPPGYCSDNSDCSKANILTDNGQYPVYRNNSLPDQAWFKFTPNINGLISASSCYQGYSTTLLIYEGDCSNLLLTDNSTGGCSQYINGDAPYNAAVLHDVCVEANKTYYILWDGLANNTVFDFDFTFLPTQYYQDNDADGYSNPNVSTTLCPVPSGYVNNNLDCDDNDANEYPGQIWYVDNDNDGFGDAVNYQFSCLKPSGYVANKDDCNDADNLVNPSVNETCGDGIDNNCDDLIDNCCPTWDIILETQYDVDTFASIYGPNCFEIDGYLRIGPTSGSSNINDLSGLYNLQSISKYLEIRNNPNLKDISGLDTLTNVGWFVKIWFNDSLEQISALKNLSSPLTALEISANPKLLSLDGLNSLTHVQYGVTITNNSSLTNLQGLNNLKTVNDILIQYNSNIETLDGLDNLTTINDEIWILQNNQLSNIEGIQNLDYVDRRLRVQNNPNLASIIGLHNVDLSNLNSLELVSNGPLHLCALNNVCTYLSNGGGHTISGNDTGCSTASEIINDCGSIKTFYQDFDGDGYGDVNNSITGLYLPPPNNYVIDSTDCNDNSSIEYPGQTWFYDVDQDSFGISSIIQCLRPQDGYLISELSGTGNDDCNDMDASINPNALELCGNEVDENCDGIDEVCCPNTSIILKTQYDVDTFSNKYSHCGSIIGSLIIGDTYCSTDITDLSQINFIQSITDDLIVQNNNHLSSLLGLEPIFNVGGDFKIINNDSLQNLDYLNILSLGGDLRLMNNNLLSQIESLHVVNDVGIDSLVIVDNISLETCHLTAFCDFMNSSNAYKIQGNLGNCLNQNSVAIQCSLTKIYYKDNDGDGYGTTIDSIETTDFPNPIGWANQIGDCDDMDFNEFPGQNWFIDLDNDGYGASQVSQCIRPIDGFTINELNGNGVDDCNDNNSSIHPNIIEICNNNIDEDCSGTDQKCCPSVTVQLISQFDIDTFVLNYPHCQNLTLIIGPNSGPSDIHDLSSFSSFTSFTNLTIQNTPNLLNINGLENVNSFTFGLVIKNTSISSLLELSKLSAITYIELRSNPNLISLEGLQGVTSLTSLLTIRDNANLTSLAGLDNLTSIGGTLQIYQNNKLKNLDPLINVTYINRLTIYNNQLLEDISGLINVTSLGNKPLDIRFNNVLESLNGLQNIDYTTISDLSYGLRISFNPLVEYCDLENICSYVANVQPGLISANGTNCKSSNDISLNCSILDTIYYDEDGDLSGIPDSIMTSLYFPPPINYSVDSLDCNDLDPIEFPEQVWYIDADNDGYGASEITQCMRPNNGFTSEELNGNELNDCDDTNPLINPGMIESCADTIDNDCDGTAAQLFTNVWIGPINGFWHDSSNWSLNRVPQSCDQVIIPANGIVWVEDCQNAIAFSVSVAESASLVLNSGCELTVIKN